MKSKRVLLCTTVAAQLFILSCKKSNDLNNDLAVTNTPASVNYQLTTTNQNAIINARTTGGNIKWISGFASATQIKFEATKGTAGVELKSNTTQHIDLFAPLPGSLGNINLAPGFYNQVELKIQLNKNGNDAALELNGTYTNNSATIPISFKANEALEIKAEKDSVTITGNTGYNALTNIDLSLLGTGITQSMLTAAQLTNGTLVISSNSNSNLYNIIVQNLNHMHHCEIEHHH